MIKGPEQNFSFHDISESIRPEIPTSLYRGTIKRFNGQTDGMIAASLHQGIEEVSLRVSHMDIARNSGFIQELGRRKEGVWPEQEAEIDNSRYYFVSQKTALEVALAWDQQTDPYGFAMLEVLREKDRKSLSERFILQEPNRFTADPITVQERVNAFIEGQQLAIVAYKLVIDPASLIPSREDC